MNCLVTKLNAVVDNDNLVRFNGIRVQAINTNVFNAINIRCETTTSSRIHIFVRGSHVANYNTADYSNTDFYIIPTTYQQDIKIKKTSDNGYVDIVLEDLEGLRDCGIHIKIGNLSVNNTIQEMAAYSTSLIPEMFAATGVHYGGSPKISDWVNMLNANSMFDDVVSLSKYRTNLGIDLTDAQILTAISKMISLDSLTDFSMINAESLAAGMVSNGRTSGTLNITTNVFTTIRFGSSMVDPTTEETNQGYQIAS